MSAARTAGLSRPRLLLLDDDPFMLGTLRRTLEAIGYNVLDVFTSGEAALSSLSVSPGQTDIIVCDLRMPGMDGIQFLRKVADLGFGGQVLLLSRESSRILHSVRKLLGGPGLDILGTLTKPAQRSDLDALLGRWRPRAPSKRTTQPQEGPAPMNFTAEEVRRAHDAEQWELHFQPKVDLQSRRVVGMEVLVRWRHPRYGLIGPDRFIPVAEECRLIDAITDWVLRTSIRQQRQWLRAGIDVDIAINVSMSTMNETNFAERACRCVDGFGALAQKVSFEITESKAMAPASASLEGLLRLRLAGFGLSIDDFGTGHSSLVQLRDVPFTELKVDRSFVHGARGNQVIRPILEGSIGLAHRLGMIAVAEGVETLDDWQLVREIGCDQAQGWFVGRPMPAGAVAEWIAAWLRGTEAFNAK